MKIENNPFDRIIEATLALYPETKAFIQFDPRIKHRKFVFWNFGSCGYTTFPDDGSEPVINISTNIPFSAMAETLAHELAHVVAGQEAEHGEKWESIFAEIHKKYMELCRVKSI